MLIRGLLGEVVIYRTPIGELLGNGLLIAREALVARVLFGDPVRSGGIAVDDDVTGVVFFGGGGAEGIIAETDTGLSATFAIKVRVIGRDGVNVELFVSSVVFMKAKVEELAGEVFGHGVENGGDDFEIFCGYGFRGVVDDAVLLSGHSVILLHITDKVLLR